MRSGDGGLYRSRFITSQKAAVFNKTPDRLNILRHLEGPYKCAIVVWYRRGIAEQARDAMDTKKG
jgi:hypothetical protein